MKKFFFLLIGLCTLPYAVSAAEKNRIDFTESFQLAAAQKLGAVMGDPFAPSKEGQGGLKTGIDCNVNADCELTEKCVNQACIPVCPGDCSGETPECTADTHQAVCSCNSTSCPTGQSCVNGSCKKCSAGEKCGCPGGQVSDGSGNCVCSGSKSCPGGQYYDDFSCVCGTCPSGEKCNCEGNGVADGAGGCGCPANFTFECQAGQKRNYTKCMCEPCEAGSESCEFPCPEGQVPDGKGACGSACQYTPAICAEENGGYEADWTVEETQGSNKTQACECTTKKRYVLMPNDKIQYAGRTLYRIKAVKDFTIPGKSTKNGSSIKITAGTLGGYIEKESNLEQGSSYSYTSTTAWVGGSAKVYGDGRVTSSGYVEGNAVVSGGSVSYGGYVGGNATLSGGSVSGGKMYDNAKMTKGSLGAGKMYGYAQNNGCSFYDGNPELYGNAVVQGCELHENVKVYGNAKIRGQDVRLWGNVKVYDNAQIGSASQIYLDGTISVYGSAKIYAKKNWTASPGYQHQKLVGNNLKIGGTAKFCDNKKTSGTYTSGTHAGSWEGQCNPPF